MEVEIGRGKKARRAYGFDEIAIVPSRRTRDPDDIDITWKIGDYRFELPLLASAMDGVVSPATAGVIGRLGGLAVLNLEGVFTRYEDADEQLERIALLDPHATHLIPRILDKLFHEPHIRINDANPQIVYLICGLPVACPIFRYSHS